MKIIYCPWRGTASGWDTQGRRLITPCCRTDSKLSGSGELPLMSPTAGFPPTSGSLSLPIHPDMNSIPGTWPWGIYDNPGHYSHGCHTGKSHPDPASHFYCKSTGDQTHRSGREPDFTPADHAEHLCRVAETAWILNDHNIIVNAALISPKRMIHRRVAEIIGKDRFPEIYTEANLSPLLKYSNRVKSCIHFLLPQDALLWLSVPGSYIPGKSLQHLHLKQKR